MKTNRQPSTVNRSLVGFTLLELLTVMAIMFVLMGMTLGAYFGMVRSTAIDGTRDNLIKTLALARQYAMTQRTRVHVVFRQETDVGVSWQTNYSYRIVAQSGTHSGNNNVQNLVVGTPRWEPNTLGGGTVFNLSDNGSSAVIRNNFESSLVLDPLKGGVKNRWYTGDRYGWMLFEAEYLPTTLMFADALPDTIVFESDGTTERKTPDYDIHVKEVAGSGAFTIVVNGLTGRADLQ